MIPPDADAAFVATMEDVLEVYQRPHDPQRPLVCLDETSKQLIIETRAPIPAKPGQPARHDYEYERNGVADLFMVFAPLEGWRHVKVTDRHTAIDYAHVLRDLSDTHFPTRPKSCWCRIISTSTSQPRSMRPFPRPRPAGSSSGSNGITPPSTAVGSTWPNPNSAFSRRNVWIAASLTSKSSPTKSPHGTTTATAPRQSRLAIRNRQRPRQAEETVPSVRVTRATRLQGRRTTTVCLLHRVKFEAVESPGLPPLGRSGYITRLHLAEPL